MPEPLKFLHRLSSLALSPSGSHTYDYDFCIGLNEKQRQEFLDTASTHRIVVRSFQALINHAKTSGVRIPSWIAHGSTQAEQSAIRNISALANVCTQLTSAGFPNVVIKSLDHWPDLGNDFDIYATGSEKEICALMERSFTAEAKAQSWSDRLACKHRFILPGVEKPIEIHLGRLGQSGQQVRMGRLILERCRIKIFSGHSLSITSPEDQIILRVLDRCYRHHSFRLCDIVDVEQVIKNNSLDFEYLKRETKRSGIYKGFCAYLNVVDEYCLHYQRSNLPLPAWVRRNAIFGTEKVFPNAGVLQIPLFPQSARLHTREFTRALRRKDLHKTLRISLLPGLVLAAEAKSRISGKSR